MRYGCFRWLSLFCAFWLSAGASAVPVENMFNEAVPVMSQAPAERRAGMSEGLQILLVRLSGTERVLYDASIQAAVQGADKLAGLLQAYAAVDEDLRRFVRACAR